MGKHGGSIRRSLARDGGSIRATPPRRSSSPAALICGPCPADWPAIPARAIPRKMWAGCARCDGDSAGHLAPPPHAAAPMHAAPRCPGFDLQRRIVSAVSGEGPGQPLADHRRGQVHTIRPAQRDDAAPSVSVSPLARNRAPGHQLCQPIARDGSGGPVPAAVRDLGRVDAPEPVDDAVMADRVAVRRDLG